MEIEEEDLLELVKAGAKIRSLPEEAEEESDTSKIVAAIEKLTAALAARKDTVSVSAPAVTVRPEINVEAPAVTIEAPAAPKQVLEWECEVTQRDSNGRMKKFKLTAVT